MRYPLLFTLLFWYIPKQQAQTLKPCGTDMVAQQLMATNSTYANEELVYENAYRKKISSSAPIRKKQYNIPFRFPVVIHILHDCSPVGSDNNPSDSKIKEVLTKTNQRFRHNYFAAPSFDNSLYAVDTDIEFYLASTDSNGEFTTGILRYNDSGYAQGEVSELSTYFSEALKWNPKQYLNIFLVADTDVAGVYLGGSERDFIIINSPFLWDGLLAHELGHYFSLKHIFSNESDQACPLNTNCLLQGDFVCDTPPKGMPGKNGGTCELPSNSCSTDEDDPNEYNPYRPISMGGLGDQPDMLSNYMDYTGDCWAAFTQGQKERMHFNIEERRMSQLDSSLTTSNTPKPAYEIALEYIQILQDTITSNWVPIVTIANNGTSIVDKLQINFSTTSIRHSNEYATKIEPNTITSITLPSLDFPSGLQKVFVSIAPSGDTIDAYLDNNQTCLSVDFGTTATATTITTVSSSVCQPVVLTKEVVICKRDAMVDGHIGPGMFRDTFSLSNGCDSIRILDVTVSAARIISEIDVSICEGEMVEGRSTKGAYIDIFTSSTGCDSIRILNLSILPAIEKTISINICSGENYEGYTTTGTYVDSLLSYNGCDSIQIIKLSVEDNDNCLTTNTIEATIAANITLYPNPATEQLSIQSSIQEPTTYTIYSITGARMLETNLLQSTNLKSTNLIDVHAWMPGLYFIRFATENGYTTKKIVVK